MFLSSKVKLLVKNFRVLAASRFNLDIAIMLTSFLRIENVQERVEGTDYKCW